VFKVLEKMGIPEAKDCTHLSYAFVELPEGAMSSRLGNDIPIKKLIDEMKNHIKEQYLSRYINEWTSEEIEETADTIADGAIKYGMTKIDPQKKIIFDMNEWLKLDGNSGPYLQYTGARIQSILNKTDELEQARTFGVQRPLEIVESRMVVKVNEFHQAVHQSIVKNNPSLLCHYCYELCQLFNRFYAECGILKLDDQEIKYQRLNLVQMVQATLKQACHLLGFQIPKRM
jgi:arginyl-tRNA synthetase